jgi:hypothetical protein
MLLGARRASQWFMPMPAACGDAFGHRLCERFSLLLMDIESVRVGLCADCQFSRRIESDRGSTFYFCERSKTNNEFPKYPRLPVLQCRGFEPATQ